MAHIGACVKALQRIQKMHPHLGICIMCHTLMPTTSASNFSSTLILQQSSPNIEGEFVLYHHTVRRYVCVSVLG